jgi:hypothetical protein
MSDPALTSLTEYSRFVAGVLNRPSVTRSTVAVWSDSPCSGIAEGEVFFARGIRLRLREELDFEAGLIAAYGDDAHHYQEKQVRNAIREADK